MHIPNTDWKDELKSLITNPEILLNQLELSPNVLPIAKRITHYFPLRVTSSFVSRMRKGDPQDPLLQQVLPLSLEEKIVKDFIKDPLKESEHNPVPGVLHKYHGRVLLTLTGGCAIHCRYCFRRHFPYTENIPGRKLDKILEYIKRDNSIYEVILSGGDPLMVTDDYLHTLFVQLADITHVKIIRIHTRLPIVLPKRINMDLIRVLTTTRLKVVCVLHCNHSQEIDMHVMQALAQLSRANILLFNQSVLLKGINDTVKTLKMLSNCLLECQVIPYYLHMLDKVEGSAHFEVGAMEAKHLYYELRAQLPGYLVPLLVQEKPEALAKIPMI